MPSIVSIGSGSSGNALLLSAGGSCILVDAGLSRKRIVERMQSLAIDPASLSGVLLTHEHTDHSGACRVLCDSVGIPAYMSTGTYEYLEKNGKTPRKSKVWTFDCGSTFQVGAFSIFPFHVPHDAVDPVGFVIDAGDMRIGVAVDIGMMTSEIERVLSRCETVVLECNYDRDMLGDSPRSDRLKRRIAGPGGHLSNEDCISALRRLVSGATRRVFLAHISAECNRPGLIEHLLEVDEVLHNAASGGVDFHILRREGDNPFEL
ncbi:MAG: MBL fold metallo-hydrolase [Victivallaceae bacterium]|nr:MBL fold metallo-hydrolase [Victivallaceae bacterium]